MNLNTLFTAKVAGSFPVVNGLKGKRKLSLSKLQGGNQCGSRPCGKMFLFTKTESCNNRTVTLDVNLLKVCKEVTPVTNHLEKAAA